jgi:predicted MFS family arabinose efflux permease
MEVMVTAIVSRTAPDARSGRLRVAELTSSVGALVLGIGLGVLLGNVLGGFGLPLLMAGALVHAWGMFDKRRLERSAGAPDVRWHVVTYWACWLLLALMALGVVGRLTAWL